MGRPVPPYEGGTTGGSCPNCRRAALGADHPPLYLPLHKGERGRFVNTLLADSAGTMRVNQRPFLDTKRRDDS